MLGTQVFSDLELDKINSVIPTLLEVGVNYLKENIVKTETDIKILKKRQLPLAALIKNQELNNSIRDQLKKIKESCNIISEIKNESGLATESIGQLFFSANSIARFFNTNSYYLNLILFWKTLFLPFFAVIAPLIGLLLPFFLFKACGTPMSVQDYLLHVRTTILKQMSIPQFLKARNSEDKIGQIMEMAAVGFALVMFISGIMNQVNSAVHLRSIWAILENRGDAINNLIACSNNILDHLEKTNGAMRKGLNTWIVKGKDILKNLEQTNKIVSYGNFWNSPLMLDDLYNWLGMIDTYTAISTLPVCIVKYNNKLGLNFKELIHPYLKSCIPNNYESRNHSILTGPNRGGKSTFCKALGLSIITAQSFGFAWATSAEICPFCGIYTALEPAGKLGYASTFEAEIVFAKSVLSLNASPLFVMMDEIFHSTNASDGLRASGVFMKSLYDKTNCVSLISTHYRELANTFKDTACSYQMLAEIGDDGLLYSYKIADGVSSKSSVDELLRAHCLL